MDLEDKHIYFVMSPHINYYHSYRGDSIGTDGFGLDLRIMQRILDTIHDCEAEGFCDGNVRISWDYSDLYWSIQLQRKFQPEILDQVINRVKQRKDEVIIGSWGNNALSILDTEGFLQQCQWNMENSMGIGLNQLFAGRIAPYIRVQETMFTQGMIELLNQVDIQGILNYYAVIPFDTARPLINPRLDWNQRYGLVNFKSTVSDQSFLMIPMYGFGDIIDHLSIEKWFKFIRGRQKSGDIEGHALVVLNHDMDSPAWKGTTVPRFMNWMPNTGGIWEIIKTVDKLEYVKLVNLLDIVPKLKVHGSCTIKQDIADGCWCGYYNWAQKYSNTQYWTIGQRARWLKCSTDTLVSHKISQSSIADINKFLRNTDDSVNSYVKNTVLFSSTTHFGMSMPFQHPHRQKTALKYAIEAYKLAEKALGLALDGALQSEWKTANEGIDMYILPIQVRGITEKERKSVESSILIRTDVPKEFGNKISINSPEVPLYLEYSDNQKSHPLEAIIPPSVFKEIGYTKLNLEFGEKKLSSLPSDDELRASPRVLKNRFVTIVFNDQGKIQSFIFNGMEFSSKNFLDSAIVFGKPKNPTRYNSSFDEIEVIQDGTNNFSASVKINSLFQMFDGVEVKAEKILKVYTNIPHVFLKVRMMIPNIKGTSSSDSNIYGVKTKYDDRWQEIIPCEIRSSIIGKNGGYLKIWKHNFLGHTTYFDLDMVEVDPKNADIDCLVSNISDGWMAVSNGEQGLLVAFNSLKAANFAFTPIKIRNKGFGDLKNVQKGQQVRINPFGTYFGKMLHHWTHGTGHAQQIIPSYSSTFKSTAPTFSGKTLEFELMITPYHGDKPSKELQSSANHFSFSPLIIFKDPSTGNVYDNYSQFTQEIESIMEEYGLEEILDKSYLEWVDIVNQEEDKLEDKERDDTNIRFRHLLIFLIDGIRSKI
ncbi:MAG: hypothetical protein JSW11_05580 [Candidatus Heimdallarchaeota archaeon]|nr:MAG: hypothetical protein JSW11_05580 [Candidatus Heimdallarchaeota archaeon]